MSPWTQRQSRIAELAALGFRNGEIATQLGIAAAVVRAELTQLYRQLEVDPLDQRRGVSRTGAPPREEAR